jgi:hypothetical protein
LQKELGQKDRLFQQQQAKLEEALRKLSDASYQQVRTHQPLACLALWPEGTTFLIFSVFRWI